MGPPGSLAKMHLFGIPRSPSNHFKTNPCSTSLHFGSPPIGLLLSRYQIPNLPKTPTLASITGVGLCDKRGRVAYKLGRWPQLMDWSPCSHLPLSPPPLSAPPPLRPLCWGGGGASQPQVCPTACGFRAGKCLGDLRAVALGGGAVAASSVRRSSTPLAFWLMVPSDGATRTRRTCLQTTQHAQAKNLDPLPGCDPNAVPKSPTSDTAIPPAVCVFPSQGQQPEAGFSTEQKMALSGFETWFRKQTLVFN